VQNIFKLNNLKNIKKIVKNNLNFKISNYNYKKKKKSIFSISLFTCTDEQSTDEDSSDILDEMSRTLENLLRENIISNEVKSLLIIYTKSIL
jgi:hypothetical protein